MADLFATHETSKQSKNVRFVLRSYELSSKIDAASSSDTSTREVGRRVVDAWFWSIPQSSTSHGEVLPFYQIMYSDQVLWLKWSPCVSPENLIPGLRDENSSLFWNSFDHMSCTKLSWTWVPSSGIPPCLSWGIKGWWWYCRCPFGALTLFPLFSSHRNPSDSMPASLILPPSSSLDPSSPPPTPGAEAPTIPSLWDCELENIWLVMSTFDPTSQFRSDQKGHGCWCSLLGPGDVCDMELRVRFPVCLPSSFFHSDSLVLSVTASPSVSWF